MRRARIRSVVTPAAVAVIAAFGIVAAVQNRGPATASAVIPDPFDIYDPVAAGEPLPAGYRPGLPRDAIAPVYAPEFTTPDGVDWPADMLVIGISHDEAAKAYPLTHLNSHEMVLDTIGDTPILVSW